MHLVQPVRRRESKGARGKDGERKRWGEGGRDMGRAKEVGRRASNGSGDDALKMVDAHDIVRQRREGKIRRMP